MTNQEKIEKLDSYAKNLENLNLDEFTEEIERACLIVVNNSIAKYAQYNAALIEDAIKIAEFCKEINYEIFYLVNPPQKQFLKWVDLIFKLTKDHLFFFYAIHGTVLKKEGDSFCIADGNVLDAVILEHLIEHKNQESKVTFLTQSLSSDPFFDLEDIIDIPQHVLSFSLTTDLLSTHVADEDVQKGVDFTSKFCKAVLHKPSITPRELKEELNTVLSELSVVVYLSRSTVEDLDIPLFSGDISVDKQSPRDPQIQNKPKNPSSCSCIFL